MGAKESRRSWGLHSIITMDGEPYAVMQEWVLYYYKTRSTKGGRAMATMPSGNVQVIALADLVSEGNMKQLAEELL